jgi:DNA (cytosine-5)-methyltransferase 1
MRARTTHETEALLVPVEGRTGKQARTMCDPMRAQTARAQDAPRGAAATTVSPGPPRTRPLVTFAAGGTHQGLIMRNNTGGTEMSTPPEEQFRTFTTAGHQSLVRWDHLTYAHDTGTMRPVAAPLPTQVVVPGDALIRPTVQVDDCTFRMLGVDEIRAGMPSPTATGCSAPNAPGCGCSATPSPHPQPRDLVACLWRQLPIFLAGAGFCGPGGRLRRPGSQPR